MSIPTARAKRARRLAESLWGFPSPWRATWNTRRSCTTSATLGIDEAILKKPGKLTSEEYEEMKKHPLIGHQILSPVRYLGPVAQMVLLSPGMVRRPRVSRGSQGRGNPHGGQGRGGDRCLGRHDLGQALPQGPWAARPPSPSLKRAPEPSSTPRSWMPFLSCSRTTAARSFRSPLPGPRGNG